MMALGAPMMKASTMYSYTGNGFSTVTGLYTGGDSVNGSFTTSVPLADDLSNATITPISYSFTDGVQTITNTTTNVTGSFQDISTDASGNIIGWMIYLTTGTPLFPLAVIIHARPRRILAASAASDHSLHDFATVGWHRVGAPIRRGPHSPDIGNLLAVSSHQREQMARSRNNSQSTSRCVPYDAV